MLNILGLARLQSGRTCKLKPWHFENNASPCLVPSKPVSNQCPQNFAQCTWVANPKKRLSTSSSSFKKPQLIQQKKLWGINTQPHCRWQLQTKGPKNHFCQETHENVQIWAHLGTFEAKLSKGQVTNQQIDVGWSTPPKKCSNMFLQAISSTQYLP